MAEDEAKLTIGANSWLTNMFVRADDSESDDSDSDDSGNSDSDSSDSGNSDSDSSDSEWDHSENGHVVDFIRWQGDSLSPISSPTIPQMIGSIPHDYDSIDSDDSDGILISCGNYHFDEEEIDEARQKMLEDVNQKWNEEMKRFCDETDGAPVATKKAKTVCKFIQNLRKDMQGFITCWISFEFFTVTIEPINYLTSCMLNLWNRFSLHQTSN